MGENNTKVEKGWYLEYRYINFNGIITIKKIFLGPSIKGPFNEIKGIDKQIQQKGVAEWTKISKAIKDQWKKYGEKAKNLDGDRPLPRPCIVCRFPV